MEDTPEIRKLRQEIWRSKSPEEKIRIVNQINEDLLNFFNEGKKSLGLPLVERLESPLTPENYIELD